MSRPRHRNGFHQRIARQQLSKQLPIPLHDNNGNWVLCDQLLGYATIELCFLRGSCRAYIKTACS
jgi:hypothetical protein